MNSPKNPQLAEAEAILATLNKQQSIDLDALIAEARTKMQVDATAKLDTTVEAPDPTLANELMARWSDLDRQAKEIAAEQEKIKSFFTDLVESLESAAGVEPGTIEQVAVHGAPVFSYKTVTSRVLDQAAVKKLWPDVPENEELWKTQTTRPRKFL